LSVFHSSKNYSEEVLLNDFLLFSSGCGFFVGSLSLITKSRVVEFFLDGSDSSLINSEAEHNREEEQSKVALLFVISDAHLVVVVILSNCEVCISRNVGVVEEGTALSAPGVTAVDVVLSDVNFSGTVVGVIETSELDEKHARDEVGSDLGNSEVKFVNVTTFVIGGPVHEPREPLDSTGEQEHVAGHGPAGNLLGVAGPSFIKLGDNRARVPTIEKLIVSLNVVRILIPEVGTKGENVGARASVKSIEEVDCHIFNFGKFNRSING